MVAPESDDAPGTFRDDDRVLVDPFRNAQGVVIADLCNPPFVHVEVAVFGRRAPLKLHESQVERIDA
jgi:hypothetical protein